MFNKAFSGCVFCCERLNERQLCLSSEYLTSVSRKKMLIFHLCHGGPSIKLPVLKQFSERQISNHTSLVEGCFYLRQDNKPVQTIDEQNRKAQIN